MWENLGKGKIDRCGLGSLTNIMSVLLLVIGFFIVVFLLEEQKSVKMDTSSCGELNASDSDAYTDWQLRNTFDTKTIGCFCLGKYKDLGNDVKDYGFIQ